MFINVYVINCASVYWCLCYIINVYVIGDVSDALRIDLWRKTRLLVWLPSLMRWKNSGMWLSYIYVLKNTLCIFLSFNNKFSERKSIYFIKLSYIYISKRFAAIMYLIVLCKILLFSDVLFFESPYRRPKSTRT